MTSLIVGANSGSESLFEEFQAVYDLVNSGVEQRRRMHVRCLEAVYDLVNSGGEQP